MTTDRDNTYISIDIDQKHTLHAIINSLPSGIFVVDLTGKIVMVNKACAESLEQTPDDCVGLSCSTVFHTEFCGIDGCCMQCAVASRQSVSGTTRGLGKKTNIPIRFTCVPLNNRDHILVGCVVHFHEEQNSNESQPSLSAEYEQVLEQLNNQWTSNQELTRQNQELYQVNQAIGIMASEKTAVELVMLMVDRLRNSAVCIGGLMRRHLRTLPSSLAASRTSLVVQDEIRRLEERMREIESLLDNRQRVFLAISLWDVVNDALFTCSRLFHDQKVSLILKKSKRDATVKANRKILVKALSMVFRQLAGTGSGNKAVIKLSHDHAKAYINCHSSLDAHLNGARLHGNQLSELPDMQPQTDLRLARQIIMEHGGEFEDCSSVKEKEYSIILPKEWRML